MAVDIAQLERCRPALPAATGDQIVAARSRFGRPRLPVCDARSLLAALVLLPALAGYAGAQTPDQLKRMTLEELMGIETSAISRIPERASVTPAAVYIITQDDIRRSGATSIPDALRLAPGIIVARMDASRWAIGMRGFPDRLSRSMLVRIDGRAVYSPLFAGTYWEVQDLVLEDIDRIEVILGPGGTLWGANAVNGIVNVVTKSAADSQGGLVSAATGSDPHGTLGVRYGGALGNGGHYRIYGKGVARGPQYHPSEADFDDWWMARGGFRVDVTGERSLTLQGDLYEVGLGSRGEVASFTPPFASVTTGESPLSGANVLARWTGALGAAGDFQLQGYYDRTSRQEIPVSESRDTFDVDFQQTLRRWRDHVLVWGVGYRLTSDRIETTGATVFVPEERTDALFSALLQDEFQLVPEQVRLALGTKLEHNDYSGFELQPSARATWTPDPAHTVVGSVTRAVRTPSRVETDYQTNRLLNPAIPSFLRLQPNPDFQPEVLLAYELGYRTRPADRMYVTVSSFFNQHDDLLSTDLLPQFVETMPGPARLVVPVTFGNTLYGSSHGAEITLDLRPADWWRWTTNYSFLQVDVSPDAGSTDVSQESNYERRTPRHQVQLQSSMDLTDRWSVDWLFRYASELRGVTVPAYATSDVRLGWRVTPQLELALVGENLHEAHHREWPSDTGIEIQRSGYVGLVWRTR